ncbi:MAG: transposase, partial [Cyanobacteria bacterium P01_E01_bin.35]
PLYFFVKILNRFYKSLVEAYRQGELDSRPRIPNYRKRGGLATVTYPKQALKLKYGKIRVPLGKTCKRWFGLDSFYILMPSNLDFEKIKELRILPRNKCFYFEFVYDRKVEVPELNQDNALMIDPGLNNWLTCVSNVDTSFIIDGKNIKSMNRWYNKQVSVLKENKPQGFWNKKLALITEKRNRQMRDCINKAARVVINHCLQNDIGTIIFGWNKRQKDIINIGKKNNSEFVPIPQVRMRQSVARRDLSLRLCARLKDRIKELCREIGLRFVETEESYTSKTSFLDGNYLPTLGEKPQDWKPSGRRVKRGLYRTAKNWYVNCDAQSAGNIGRKVSTKDLSACTLGIDLSRLSRALLTAPQRISLWSANGKVKGCGFCPS